MRGTLELWGSPGCGSIIVEMALALTDLPHRVVDVPYQVPGEARQALLRLNPLGQVPVLVLPDGTVMTESAAILLHIAEQAPASGLLPPVGDPARPGALARLVQLCAAVYPTFTYGDFPERWTLPGEPAARLRATTNAAREAYFRRWQANWGGGPFALGAGISALDLYLAAMTAWRPGPQWFQREAPSLFAAAEATRAHPALAPIAARHGDALFEMLA